MFRWNNWVSAAATVALLTVSSCASSTGGAGQPAAPSPATSAAPPAPPPPPPVTQKLVLRGVHFDFNKTDIRPGDTAVLDEAITTLKASPNVAINVNGYCDAIGRGIQLEAISVPWERRGELPAEWPNPGVPVEGV